MLESITVLITGERGGLGAAMARGVAQAGARVVLVDASEAAVGRTEVEIRSRSGAQVLAITADITSADQVARMRTISIEQFGAVDVLVSNAGLGQGAIRRDFLSRPVRTWEIPVDAWRRILDVNVTGGFLLTRAFVPDMLRGGFGRIINVTTNLNAMLRAGFAPYGGSKAAIEAGSASLAKELAGTGVTVNVLIPGGPADTDMIPRDDEQDRSSLVAPEAMVEPLVWLCGKDAGDCSGRRIVAGRWQNGRSWRENVAAAFAAIGWPDLTGTDRIAPMAGT